MLHAVMAQLAPVIAQSNEGPGVVGIVFQIAITVLGIVAMWKVFTKAGQPGWASIIPIYNVITLLKIVGRPWWWLLLLFIPIVNIVILILAMIDLAKSFGKGVGFGIGLILLSPIFMLILAFSDAQYVGPAGAQARPALA